MSYTNMNRKLSVTRSQRDPAAVENVDLDYVYEKGNIHLTLSLGVVRDFSTSKSRENLMLELEDVWKGFLKALKAEGLISDSSSKEITGVQVNTSGDIQTGPLSRGVSIPLGNPYLEIG
jgi:hypothetical protein